MKIFNHFLLTLVTFILLKACGSAGEQQPPNILFIMSDDHAYQAISAYSDHLMQTPNIDRIAKEGMLFTNACVTNSICAPSRAVILTGKHCHINGKVDNHFPFDTTNVTFPQILQQHGYQTALLASFISGTVRKALISSKYCLVRAPITIRIS
jgi:hypothetical protein